MYTVSDVTLKSKAMQHLFSSLEALQKAVVACRRCPRLRRHCEEVARLKRRAYREWEYWGLPVPGFGDPEARLVIIGLAPAAHGANRTGRMFTGDRSGDLLYKVLHDTGFASQPECRSRQDGMRLKDAYITAAVRCAPPSNKPSREEQVECRKYLAAELDLLTQTRVVVALGRLAFDAYLSVEIERGMKLRRADFPFGHNRLHRIGDGHPILISSYHPSQQNTLTGRLTEPMLREVFLRASGFVGAQD